MSLSRRNLLALPLLAGCAERLVPLDAPGSTAAARALLADSAAAQGAGALKQFSTVDVSYDGTFAGLVDRLQPELVDASRRAVARDRLDLRAGSITQEQSGPGGAKRVERTPGLFAQGTVRVLLDGIEATDRPRRDAAAVVADCYQLFLLGPMLLAGRWGADRTLAMAVSGTETVVVAGQNHACDVLRVSMRPGLGLSDGDELVLWIDQAARLMRRVRFTLNGHLPTRGAVAETDCWGYAGHGGVQFAAAYEERLLRPLPLDVHRWRMTGIMLERLPITSAHSVSL